MVKKLVGAIHRRVPGRFRFLIMVQPGCAEEAVRFAGEEDEIWVLPGEGNDSQAPLPADGRIRQLTHADGNLARSLQADLLFVPTGVSDCWVPDLPLVSIAVDTLHKDLPECLPVEEVKARDFWFDRMTSYSHSVICISEWVAAQVAKHFPNAAGRLVVARAAVASQVGTGENEVRETAPSAFLYPANAWAHKNHETLLIAYRLLRHTLGDAAWDLVLTGSDDDAMARVKRLAELLGIADRVKIPGYLPAPEFAALLARTGAVVFPSLYEGFGIPVLEAMHRGIPVIAGPNGSIPEVAGEACLFTDVRNPEALAAAMRRMQEDAELREMLARAGRERAASFDFDAEAQTIAETFETAIADFDRAGITWRPFGR